MTRNGKIARLPREIREQLNRRLQNNEPGQPLLDWLNGLPEAREMLAAQFGGIPFNKQNLSEWRRGGHREWLTQQEVIEQVKRTCGDADELKQAAQGQLTDKLALVIGARYAAVVAEWDGNPDGVNGRKLRGLRAFCQDVVELRRGDHSAARLEIEQERLKREREETEEEIVEHFQRWAKHPKVREWIVENSLSDAERRRRIREIYGLPPQEEVDENPEPAAADAPAEGSSQTQSNPVKPDFLHPPPDESK